HFLWNPCLCLLTRPPPPFYLLRAAWLLHRLSVHQNLITDNTKRKSGLQKQIKTIKKKNTVLPRRKRRKKKKKRKRVKGARTLAFFSTFLCSKLPKIISWG